MKNFILIVLLSFSSPLLLAQKAVKKNIDTVVIKEITREICQPQTDSLQLLYLEILKNTNEQLNNNWTPVNFILGTLGVFLTIGLFAGGFLIARQSLEFKKQQKEVFDKVEDDSKELRRVQKEIEADLLKKQGEFNKIIVSSKEVIDQLAFSSIPEVKTAIKQILKKSGNMYIVSSFPLQPVPSAHNYTCLFLCTTPACENIWRGSMSESEYSFIGGTTRVPPRPPVIKRCPKCNGLTFITRPNPVEAQESPQNPVDGEESPQNSSET